MPTTLANLKFNRIIAHEVVLASELDKGITPHYSEHLLELPPNGQVLLCKRITDSLGSDSHSIELEVENDQERTSFDFITKLLDLPDREFVGCSKELALMLTRSQTAGTIKAGICMLLDGTVGGNASGNRFVCVLKAESDASFVKETTSKSVMLKYINETVLGAQQRLYKIGCFIETKKVSADTSVVRSKGDFEALVYDHQMSNTSDSNAARYFYGTFLGCRLAENSPRLTRTFYEESSKHIDESKLPIKKRVELKYHLVSYLKCQEPQISPRNFAEGYLPPEMREDYLGRFKKIGFPHRNIAKDIKLIKRRLQVRRMIFSSKVRISAPEENFNDLVQVMEHKEGWTSVQIKGDLETQT